MPREKGFSEQQTNRKTELINKYGYVVLEDIEGDIIVKDPSKITIESNTGIKKSIGELVNTHNAIMKLRQSDLYDALLSLLEIIIKV